VATKGAVGQHECRLGLGTRALLGRRHRRGAPAAVGALLELLNDTADPLAVEWDLRSGPEEYGAGLPRRFTEPGAGTRHPRPARHRGAAGFRRSAGPSLRRPDRGGPPGTPSQRPSLAQPQKCRSKRRNLDRSRIGPATAPKSSRWSASCHHNQFLSQPVSGLSMSSCFGSWWLSTPARSAPASAPLAAMLTAVPTVSSSEPAQKRLAGSGDRAWPEQMSPA
jgi:hypothetical protein